MRYLSVLNKEDCDCLITKICDEDHLDLDQIEQLVHHFEENSRIIGKYIPNSLQNTRNSWLEYTVISCTDRIGLFLYNQIGLVSHKVIFNLNFSKLISNIIINKILALQMG